MQLDTPSSCDTLLFIPRLYAYHISHIFAVVIVSGRLHEPKSEPLRYTPVVVHVPIKTGHVSIALNSQNMMENITKENK
jgi:hypothetical protein